MEGLTSLICAMCGETGARIRRVSRSYGKGAALLVIENVPVVSCPHCGQSYLTAETLHEIERIKRHRSELAAERPVAVAALGQASCKQMAIQTLNDHIEVRVRPVS
jgi:YgiT-type zinc finger domain-containing protein